MELGRMVSRVWLAAFAAAAGAALGVLMSIGGLALALAVLSTPQPGLQGTTAVVLIASGIVNLWSSVGIWRAQPRALVRSAGATMALMIYLAGALRDFGEPFWAHLVYLLLLFAVRYQTRGHRRLAAEEGVTAAG
jgi:hypothetical protein